MRLFRQYSTAGDPVLYFVDTIFILIFRSGTLSDAALAIARSQLVGLKAEAKLKRITIARTVPVRVWNIPKQLLEGEFLKLISSFSRSQNTFNCFERSFRRLEATPS